MGCMACECAYVVAHWGGAVNIEQLSDKAKSVCAWHYGNAGSGCGKCPIHAPCSSGTQGRLTDASLIQWQQRVNAAAEAVAL